MRGGWKMTACGVDACGLRIASRGLVFGAGWLGAPVTR